VTNPDIIEKSAKGDLINAVIIKPNQIGTVSEACKAIKIAHENGLKCIVSHRSGETKDVFIIHLARAAGVFGLKIGAPVRERTLKFNEFIRIFSK
jgi:enolase